MALSYSVWVTSNFPTCPWKYFMSQLILRRKRPRNSVVSLHIVCSPYSSYTGVQLQHVDCPSYICLPCVCEHSLWCGRWPPHWKRFFVKSAFWSNMLSASSAKLHLIHYSHYFITAMQCHMWLIHAICGNFSSFLFPVPRVKCQERVKLNLHHALSGYTAFLCDET